MFFKVANVVEEDEEISLNHITANEVSSQDERFFSEKTINLEEREDTLPNFLKTKESKEHFVNIWEGFQKNFRDIGFYGKLDFSSNIMIIYHIKSRQIYQLYKFVEFKKMQDIKVFLEDIFASVKFALL